MKKDKMVWVACLNDDDVYQPYTYPLNVIYKGENALPYFEKKEACQDWCNKNPYKSTKKNIMKTITKEELIDKILKDLEYVEERYANVSNCGDMRIEFASPLYIALSNLIK